MLASKTLIVKFGQYLVVAGCEFCYIARRAPTPGLAPKADETVADLAKNSAEDCCQALAPLS
jgi:hypothetical protein